MDLVIQQLAHIQRHHDGAQLFQTHVLTAQNAPPAQDIGVVCTVGGLYHKAAGGGVQRHFQRGLPPGTGVGHILPDGQGMAVQVGVLQAVDLAVLIDLFQQQRAHAGEQIVVVCGLRVCLRQGVQLFLNIGIHCDAAGQGVDILNIIVYPLHKKVQLLQGLLVELFLKHRKAQMQRTDHQRAAEQGEHHKNAHKFLCQR